MTPTKPTVLLLAVVLAQSLGTQNKPDFSGRWILLSVENDRPGTPSLEPKAAAELTIVQSAAAVRIDYPAGQGAVYPRSGSHWFQVSGVVGADGEPFVERCGLVRASARHHRVDHQSSGHEGREDHV